MGNKIKIGLAKPDDIREIQEVFYKTWLDTYPNEKLGITVDDIEGRYKDAFTDEKLAKGAEKIINPPEGHDFFVARDGEKIVGVCNAVKSEAYNRISAIYVLPDYQRSGIGKLFWNEARKFFDPKKDIVVHLGSYNQKSINFYKSLGFVETGKQWMDENLKMKSGAVIPQMEMIIKA